MSQRRSAQVFRTGAGPRRVSHVAMTMMTLTKIPNLAEGPAATHAIVDAAAVAIVIGIHHGARVFSPCAATRNAAARAIQTGYSRPVVNPARWQRP